MPKTAFDNMPLDKFAAVVNKFARTNGEKQADAISRADSYSFQVANPWLLRTEKNTALINHWLTSRGITNPTFPDFQAAGDALAGDGLLSIEEASYASHLDGIGPRTFKGALTGNTYDSLDTMIKNERHAVLTKPPKPTQEEIDLDNLPIEEFQERVKNAERDERARANAPHIQMNADAFLVTRPEIADSDRNARLINMQLKANNVYGDDVNIDQFERATNQLLASGLLTLKPSVVAKQRQAEVNQLAADHKAKEFNLEEAYNLPLDEIRRRANGNYSGR